MNYALLTRNDLTGLTIAEEIMRTPCERRPPMPAGFRQRPADLNKQAWAGGAHRRFLRRSMKKIFASLTLAAFMLGATTAFALAQDPAAKTMAKTATSHKKKSKKRRHHASATSATTPKKK
jgi:hypothetical protein